MMDKIWKNINTRVAVGTSDIILEEAQRLDAQGSTQIDLNTYSEDDETKLIAMKETLESYVNSLFAFQVSFYFKSHLNSVLIDL